MNLEEVFFNKELSDAVRDIVKNSPVELEVAILCLKHSNDLDRDALIIKNMALIGMTTANIFAVIRAMNL